MKVKGKIFKQDMILNRDRKFGSEPHYYSVFVETDDGFKPCLLTESQLQTGIKRAADNKEDIELLDMAKGIIFSIFKR